MRTILELLRLDAEQHLSVRQIAASLGLPRSTVADYLRRFRSTGLPWPLPAEVDEQTLEARLFAAVRQPPTVRPVPDCAYLHRERKRPGVTLQLLWLEYKAAHPDGYQYTQFCAHYGRWLATIDPVLRQEHRAGERVFVDYAGQTMPVVDPATGEVREAQVFVGALGASHYLYVEATWTQGLPDWIAAHVRMYEDFGGVPALTVPDNLKAGVQHACFYEPELNPTYQDLAAHYGTTVLPTRTAQPRDKAKVETGVQIVERWVLAPLRNHTFFSLAELNQALAAHRQALNARPFQKLAGSRCSLFETLERPALRPLPATRYVYATWKKARVNIDYHITVEGHGYSVPYTLVRQEVDVRLTSTTVEILHRGRRVAGHVRSAVRGRFTTDPGHRPKAHQRHLEWTPSRLIHWGASIGTATGHLVQQILDGYPHPEQGYRACLGLFSLGKRYGAARLEAACARALATSTPRYRSVKSILVAGLDRLPADEPVALVLPLEHAHVRGPAYYATLIPEGAPC
ncbi:MAG: IS21 family transposase [Gemmatimonadota bacterium]|jgi:transposase